MSPARKEVCGSRGKNHSQITEAQKSEFMSSIEAFQPVKTKKRKKKKKRVSGAR